MIVTAEQLLILYLDDLRLQMFYSLGTGNGDFVSFVNKRVFYGASDAYDGSEQREMIWCIIRPDPQIDPHIEYTSFIFRRLYDGIDDLMERVSPKVRTFFEEMARKINELASTING